jgi:DNA ligase (NAD+)
MDIQSRMQELVLRINQYNEAYYQNNESLISDQAFDELMHELHQLELQLSPAFYTACLQDFIRMRERWLQLLQSLPHD